MRDYLAALRGLTVRGCAFLATGGACVTAAAIIGEQDLIAVAVLLAALPLVAAAFVARMRYRLACTRRLDPHRVTAGDTVSVRIRLDNVSRLRSSVLLVEDPTPHLGHRARFVVDRIEPGGSRDLSYTMRAQSRGRYQVGPLTIRLTDPFGLCELERSFRGKDDLTVAPALERLPLVPSVGLSALNNEVRRSVARAGDEESMTRPYRSGDDLRKVHWKTSARVGELMVRRDERPLTGAATVLLDTRAEAWPAVSHPDDAFSWAVSAAGSIAVNLARSGYGVRLMADTQVAATGPGNAVGALLDQLAVIEPNPMARLNPALASLRSAEHSGMVVVVLGGTDQATATLVAGARPRQAPAIALLVDVVKWGNGEPAGGADLDTARHILTRHGWTVLAADRSTRLVDTWPAIFRPDGGGGRRRYVSGSSGQRGPGRSRPADRPARTPGDHQAGGMGGGGRPGAGGGANGATAGGPGGRRSAPAPPPAVPPPPPTGPLYRPGSPHEPSAQALAAGEPTSSAGRGW